MARKKRGWNRLAKFSLGDLQRLVERKQAEIEKLRARREAVVAQLADLNSAISAARGPVSGVEPRANGAMAGPSAKASLPKPTGRPKEPGKRRGRKAGKKGQSDLHNAIRAALEKSKDPMKLSVMAVAVRKSGYKTKSANFGVILGQRLPEMRDVKRVGRGVYAMKS